MLPVLFEVPTAVLVPWLPVLIPLGLVLSALAFVLRFSEDDRQTGRQIFVKVASWAGPLLLALGLAIGLLAITHVTSVGLSTFWMGILIVTGIGVFLVWPHLASIDSSPQQRQRTLLWMIGGAVIGGHLGFMLWDGGARLLSLDTSSWFGMLVVPMEGSFEYYGALLGGLLALWISLPRDQRALSILDRLVPAVSLVIGLTILVEWISGTRMGVLCPADGAQALCAPMADMDASATIFQFPFSPWFAFNPSFMPYTTYLVQPLMAVAYGIGAVLSLLSRGLPNLKPGSLAALFLVADGLLHVVLHALTLDVDGVRWAGTAVGAVLAVLAGMTWLILSVPARPRQPADHLPAEETPESTERWAPAARHRPGMPWWMS